MKKYLNYIVSAAILLAGVACTEVERTVFRVSDVTAPVLGEVTTTDDGKGLIVEYTPGSVEEGLVPYHTVAIVKGNDREVSYSLSTSDVKDAAGKVLDNTRMVTFSEIKSALVKLGFEYSSTVNYELAARISIQDGKADNGRNGYKDSEKTYAGSVVLPDPPKENQGGGADPYAGWEKSAWSVIGSIASTGNSWNADIEMVTDGTWHVAKAVVLTTSDEFKFRKDADWAVNMGGTFESFDAEFSVEQDGSNIKVTEEGTYDLLLNPDGSVAKIIVAQTGGGDPYASWENATDWSVIGSISSTGNSWNKDEPMLTNGTWYVCKELELTTANEFKFRKDADWAVNFGGTCEALGAEFAVEQDGSNIKVPEDGTFDILLNPGEAKAIIVKSGEDPGI